MVINEKRRQVNQVLFITLVLNLVVSISKIILGTLTGALAISADGFHSMADSASNVVALIANTVAGRPPDEDHPYGHERFETLATLGIGLLLLLTAWETVQGVIERVFQNEMPDLTIPAFMVMVVTLVINIFVNRYQVAAGKRLESELLLADAAHTGTDILVTLSVLASMTVTVTLGWAWVDIFTALVVVALIVRASWQIVKRTGRILVDTAPIPAEQLSEIVLEIPAVSEVVRARSRGALDALRIDMDIKVDPATTTEQTNAIAEAIEQQLMDRLERVSEVEVHFVTDAQNSSDVTQVVRALADTLNLKTHNVYLSELEGGQILDLHVEVAAGQTLEAAHQQVSELEHRIYNRFPAMVRIDSHIEPIPALVSVDEPTSTQPGPELEDTILSLLRNEFEDADWHDLKLLRSASSTNVNIHASLPPELTIEEAHEFSEHAERFLRTHLTHLDRVTIHTEPRNTV